MQSDTGLPDEPRDPEDGAAAFRPVTDEMMDHAARNAAEQAESVARAAAETRNVADAAASSAGEAVSDAGDAGRQAADLAAEAGGNVVAAAAQVSDDAADVARQAAGEAANAARQAAGEATTAAVRTGDAMAQYHAKVSEMMRASLASTTSHFAALVQAKSVPEALSLNADHLRRQFELMTSQGRELATLAQRIALEALQPFKGPDGR